MTLIGRRTPFVLSLGSNLGDRRRHLNEGLEFLARHVSIEAVSSVVESAAWGAVPTQPDFLNLVLRGSTEGNAFDLLEVAQRAEAASGRVRTVRRGPRTLDVDLIFFGLEKLETPRLTIPHPHWAERPFVSRLIPEVAGDLVDPGSGMLLRELARDEPLPPELRLVESIAVRGHPTGAAPR